uniref:Uncharacterized protein n=1 Tax=Glossina pallidipes TaxID=7398 RepID=A0A1A9ZPU3_GLOPL
MTRSRHHYGGKKPVTKVITKQEGDEPITLGTLIARSAKEELDQTHVAECSKPSSDSNGEEPIRLGTIHPALPKQKALHCHNKITAPCSAQATGPATVLRSNSCQRSHINSTAAANRPATPKASSTGQRRIGAYLSHFFPPKIGGSVRTQSRSSFWAHGFSVSGEGKTVLSQGTTGRGTRLSRPRASKPHYNDLMVAQTTNFEINKCLKINGELADLEDFPGFEEPTTSARLEKQRAGDLDDAGSERPTTSAEAAQRSKARRLQPFDAVGEEQELEEMVQQINSQI